MNRLKLSWEDARVFLAVAEHRSFSAAAKALGVAQPTISRHIQQLETMLEQQLFERGKHGASATEAATKLLPAAEQMAKWAAEFNRQALGVGNAISGVVKIAASPGVAVEQLGPFAARLLAVEPDITLEVSSSIEHIDLTRGDADIAIRTQYPKESELVVMHTAHSQPIVVSSKAYADTLKQPCSWRDLKWVTWSSPYLNVTPRPILEKLIPNFEPVFSSDDYLAQKAAVICGVGAMIIGKPIGFDLPNFIRSELVEIDIGVTIPRAEFYIVCAKSMQQVPRVRVVIERLIEALEEGAGNGLG
jgi:DNA-binding transcriptional LysR family regulator